jgi:hypothetical protein
LRSASAITLVLVTAVAALLFPRAAAAAPSTRILGVSWAKDGPVGKITLRFDGPVNYRTLSSGSTITVDVWRARHTWWGALSPQHPYVRSILTAQITGDLARIRIYLKRPARYKTFVKSEPNQLTVLVIPPWMATTPLPASVAYEKIRVATGTGSTAAHVLRVDPRARGLEIRPVLAGNVVTGREPTSVIATRSDAIAAINGGFFADTGMPLGMVVINGELVSAPLPRRSVFAIGRNGEAVIRSFEFVGRLKTADGVTLWVSGVNRTPHAKGASVFTRHYGPLTPPLQMAAVVREDLVETITSGRIWIPADGYVLGVNASDAALITGHIRVGERLGLSLVVSPDLEVISALGAGPRLVKGGAEYIPFTWEWFSSRLLQTRAPRSAVGITASGKLVFVTVDGRSQANTGMTLHELAQLLVRLGAREAINLDGGGSSTMVVGGRIVNEPSGGGERLVASALIVLQRPAP